MMQIIGRTYSGLRVKTWKIHIQTSRKDFHDVGDGRFFVDADFETTFVESGVVMKGERDLRWISIVELFQKHCSNLFR